MLGRFPPCYRMAIYSQAWGTGGPCWPACYASMGCAKAVPASMFVPSCYMRVHPAWGKIYVGSTGCIWCRLQQMQTCTIGNRLSYKTSLTCNYIISWRRMSSSNEIWISAASFVFSPQPPGQPRPCHQNKKPCPQGASYACRARGGRRTSLFKYPPVPYGAGRDWYSPQGGGD